MSPSSARPPGATLSAQIHPAHRSYPPSWRDYTSIFVSRFKPRETRTRQKNDPNRAFGRQTDPHATATLPRPAGSPVLVKPPPAHFTAPVGARLTHAAQISGRERYRAIPRYTSLYPVHTRFSLPPARYGARPVTPRWYPTAPTPRLLRPVVRVSGWFSCCTVWSPITQQRHPTRLGWVALSERRTGFSVGQQFGRFGFSFVRLLPPLNRSCGRDRPDSTRCPCRPCTSLCG